jgi:O-acetyl-ADP-ribose deacetylase (regulator of RNase III)
LKAFPCIATGIYGYPNEEAATVALNTVRNFLEKDKIVSI